MARNLKSIMEPDDEDSFEVESDGSDQANTARKTPRERFLAVAPRRTQAVLEKLRLLAHCGNPSTYNYENDEVHQIFSAIQQELDRTRARFEKDGEPEIFRLEVRK